MIVTVYNLTSGPLLVRNPYTGTLAAGASKAVHNVPTTSIAGNVELQDLLAAGSIQISIAPDTGADPRIASPTEQNWLSWANQAASALVQYGIVRSVDATGSPTGLVSGVAPAQADTTPHSTGVVGPVQNSPAASTGVTGLARVATSGQLGFMAFDLGGGHVEPVAGSACYLSQTRSMYAQADAPVSGIVMQVGTVVSNGIAKVGDATTGIALVLVGAAATAAAAAATVHTDATLTGDGSVGTPLSVVPQFGSDTLVKLPNSATVQKTVLEMVTSYTSNTSGAEASKLVFELLSGGAQVTALDLRPTQVLMSSASAGAPAFSFQADSTSGIYYQGGTVWISAQGVPKLGVVNSSIFTTSGSPLYINTDFARGIGQVGSNVFLFSGADIQMGADGALATTATVGFLTIPTCAGPPTGIATPRSGHVAFIFDTTNSKLWSSTGGGTWKGVALA